MDGIVMPTFLFGPSTKPNRDVRHRAGQTEPDHGKPRVVRAGRRVLIVEDEAMIAGLIETDPQRGRMVGRGSSRHLGAGARDDRA